MNGFSASSSTKLCMRWLIPMPVRPAMHTGIQPPLGVTEIAQPCSSAAWIDVVPARKVASKSAEARGDPGSEFVRTFDHWLSRPVNGLV